MTRSTLVVDFGGVLTTSVLESYTAFCVEEGIDLRAFKDLLRAAFRDPSPDDPIVLFECGKLSVDAFEARMAQILGDGLGRTLEPVGIARRMMGNVTPDDRMIAAVGDARAAGRTTALLSNSWGDTDYSPVEHLFDVVVVSAREGIRKPDRAIFELTLDRLGVPARDCIFVDDARPNCEAAEDVGMRAILHREATTTIPELERELGVALER